MRRDLPTTRLWPAPSARLNAINMLELWAAGTYCTDLPPTHAAGKRATPGAESRPWEGVINSKAPKQLISVSPVSLVGSYHLDGAVNGVRVSLLMDTGASVTLLQKDAWDRVSQAASASPPLLPCLLLGLVGVDGTPLQTCSTSVTLELNGNRLPVEVVVISPLTSEGILGLDFLHEQRVSIDLASEELRLRGQGIIIPLRIPLPNSCSCVSVRAVSNIDVPAGNGTGSNGMPRWTRAEWHLDHGRLLYQYYLGRLAVVQPKLRNMIPVRLMNCTSEPHTVYAGKQIALAETISNNACLAAQGSAKPRSTTLTQEKEEML